MVLKPPQPPGAFLSYTRFDDQHDGGAISEFCRRLASAVQAVTGVPFGIFRDIGGIGIGEHWPGKLDRMLDEARFFIPIITPSYFTSRACRDELEKFLRAEAERERNDLVLPIYYIESDVLEDEALRATDPLASTLHERQRQDWRALRFEPFEAANVRRALEHLARDIVRARKRTMPARPTLQPSAATPMETGITAASSLDPQHAKEPSKATIAPPAAGTVFRDIDAPWCPELVVIPPGEFMMGSTKAERQWAVAHGISRECVEREKPQHRVHMAYSLAVGRYPVTFEEYDHFALRTRRAPPGDEGWGRDRQPVINVSWEDARAYVEWLAAETRQPYRLLSEAEWEYACRAGTMTRYWWGDEITLDKANYGGHLRKTSQVGSYPASPLGLCDTHGNVWEWVEDSWHNSYDGARNDGAAWTAGNNPRRVLRGGSWSRKQAGVRSASRTAKRTDYRENKIGFRVARTLSGNESLTHSIQTGRTLEREGGKILDKPSHQAGAGIGGNTPARRRVFLAHAREDKLQIRQLHADLKARGLDPWLDEVDLMPGQIWKEEIPKAIRQAGVFLACLSSRSLEKVGYVQNEFRLALSQFGERPPGWIYLIPVRLDECVVPDLQIPDRGLSFRDIQWVDLWEDGSFDRLVQAIEYALESAHTQQLTSRSAPAEQLASRDAALRSILASGTQAGSPPEPGTVFRDLDAPWCPQMVVIPPGDFLMGSTDAEYQWAVGQGAKPEWVECEKPQHLVRIAYSLAVGRYPLTFQEYSHFARSTGRAQPSDEGWGRGRRPVINVDLKDAKSFIAWLSVQSGQAYRLLSEAEWEYACRGGTMTRYWWGDEITPENANYGANVGKTTEVGSYPANPFGLYDMHGNVWEWVEDRWHDSYVGAPNDGSAWILGTAPDVVLRGGAWFNGPRVVRSAVRIRDNPDYRYYFVGFRVARTTSRSESVTP